MKSGYKIISLNGVAINTSTGTTYTGIYDKIEGNLGKPILLTDIVIGSTEMVCGAFIQPYLSGTDFVFKAFNYTFTVTDDDLVTVASANVTKSK